MTAYNETDLIVSGTFNFVAARAALRCETEILLLMEMEMLL